MTVAESRDVAVQQSGTNDTGRWQNTSKGRGKVVPRTNVLQTTSSGQACLRLSGMSSQEAEHGAKDGDFRPRYPADTEASWLGAIHLDHVTQGYRALEAMRSSMPCLMRKSPLVTALVNRWTIEHLQSVLGAAGDRLGVLCAASQKSRFLECDKLKNVFGSHYHIREPESQMLEMTFDEFAQSAQQWRSRQLFLRETIMTYQNRGTEAIAKRPLRQQLETAEPLGDALLQEIDSRIDWLWLHSLLHAQKHGPVLRVDLQVAPANGLLPARYECTDRIFAQVTGRRRILLVPPSQAFEGMYPYPVHHPYDRYSMVDLDDVDAAMWPDAGRIQGTVCIMQPGDLLLVPQFWFAHAQYLDMENTDLVFHLHPGARIRSEQCVPLQVSRLLEERLAEAEGVKEVRHWLNLIANDEEADHINLETLKGYRRIVLCEQIRDEMQLNLGKSAACYAVLRGMIKDRLLPTPWLNQDFREPLYLKDKPVRIEDTRTEEERKYPALFRRKLEGEGWSVPMTVSTVPIPGYNTPKLADHTEM